MLVDGEDTQEEVPLVDDEGRPISESDIVFNCSHCGHSLVIDYRGAGLVINCTECGEAVEVPIPEGMQLDDLDQSPAEQEAQIGILRTKLAKAEERIGGLVSELAAMKEERARAESEREILESRLEEARAALEKFMKARDEIGVRLAAIGELLS